MEYYDLSLNDLNLIRHLRKVGRLLLDLPITRTFKKGRNREILLSGQGLWLAHRSGSLLRARIANPRYRT
jgi:hypothetical protein